MRSKLKTENRKLKNLSHIAESVARCVGSKLKTENRKLKNLMAVTVIGILLTSSNLFATQLGGQAGSAMRLGLGADRIGMGDVGTALSGAGMSWYYNPASPSFQPTRQASLGYRSMSLDRSMMYAGYSMPLQENAGVAIGFVRAATDDIDARDSNGKRFDMLTYSDNLIHGTFCLRPHENFALGISVKWMFSAAPKVLIDDKTLYAYGMGIDLGIQGRWRKYRFGLEVRDINSKVNWDASQVWGDGRGALDDNIPLMFRLGAAYDPRDDLTLAGDLLINPSEAGKSADGFSPHLGAEWRTLNWENKAFSVRAGYNGDMPTFGMGLGMKLRRGVVAKMDYAYVIDTVSPAGSHLIGWTFGF